MSRDPDRVAGALLGVHAGDALGAAVEFSDRETIRERYPDGLREIVGGGPFSWPPGHATDDTDLTRAVLLAHLEHRRDPAQDVVRLAADRMLDWLDGRWPDRREGSTPRDIGGATHTGLARYVETRDPRRAGAGPDAAGNGSLMRCIPTALAEPDRERRILLSREISAITHDDDRATASCAAYNELVAALLGGATPEEAVAVARAAADELGPAAVTAAIDLGADLDLPDVAGSGPLRLTHQASGYVLDSLALAVAAVLDPRPAADVIVDVVHVGRDTDSNAAVAGGLVGTRDGASALPDAWLAKLQFYDEFLAAAETLA